MLGLAALATAVEHPVAWNTSRQEWKNLFDQIERNPDVRLLRSLDLTHQGPLFSLVHQTKRADEIANALRYDHEIIVRDGLHCAPLAHQTLGTLAQGGSVRIGFSPFHTNQDLELLARALDDVLR